MTEKLQGNPEIVNAMERLADHVNRQPNTQLAKDIALLIYQMPFTAEHLMDMKKGKMVAIDDMTDKECRHALTCLVRDARMAEDMLKRIVSDLGLHEMEPPEEFPSAVHVMSASKHLH